MIFLQEVYSQQSGVDLRIFFSISEIRQHERGKQNIQTVKDCSVTNIW